jgi:hypothetical protein
VISTLRTIAVAFYAGGFVAAWQMVSVAGEYASGGRISSLDRLKIALLWPIVHRLGREDA